MPRKRPSQAFTYVFIGSAAFFIVALGVAALLFFSGTNTVSTKNVEVAVSGPPEVDAGSTLSLQVVVTNRNPVPIQLADLVIAFPQGTRSAADVSVSMPRTRISLGTVDPGVSVNRTVTAVLFGQSGASAPVTVSVEYRTPSSNAVFSSDTTYTTRIRQSPASITVSGESQVISGQATTLTVTVTSNAPQPLSDMLLAATYPPGFTLQSADPSPIGNSSVWALGDIEPAGSRTITLRGTFTGEDGDMRALTFQAGTRQSGSDTGISAPLAASETDLTVAKPFVSASILLNGSVADQHTVARGAAVSGEVDWANNLPVAVQNLSITLSLKGSLIDPATVRVQQGFYDSAHSQIVWDKTTNPDFAGVGPGKSGALSFSFSTLPLSKGTFKNTEIDFAAAVHANRSSEGNVPQTVDSSASTKALVATNLALTASLSHASGSGPIPPKANQETVYIVAWNLSNSANAVANGAVTGSLPNYVRYIGAVSPSGENVSYDDNKRTITWNPGDLAAGGLDSVSFKVGVTPSVSQVAQSPAVVTGISATAFDRFVQDNVTAAAGDLTTGSAASSQDQGNVVP